MTTSNGNKQVYLNDLHFEHKMWLNELQFFEDEIETYKHRLEELVQRNTNKDMLAQLESYQNQFILTKEVIDTFKHDIKLHNKVLAKHAEEHPIAIDHQHFDDHSEMRDKMVTFRNNFQELKDKFYKYLSNWM